MSATRPSYPWSEGDALFADELNAAIANAGSGAVLNTKTFNVLDHGVRMDGVTDDYAALNTLVVTAGATPGAVVYFPPSATPLMLSTCVAVPSNQTWWAYPGSVTIKPTPGNVASVMLLGAANVSNIRVCGLTFDGGGQDFPNAGVVTQPYRVNGLTFDQVTFQNCRGPAVNGSGVNDFVVRGCSFVNIGNHWKTSHIRADQAPAFSHTSGDGVTWGFRTRMLDCSFLNCGGDFVNLGVLQDVQVTGNTFTRTDPWPWDVTGGTDSAYNAAVFLFFCTKAVLANNVMIGMSGNAIDCPGAWDTVISNNVIRDTGQGGIGVFDGSGYEATMAARGCRNITITGNVVANSGNWPASVMRSGIQIGSSSVADSNIRVVNNISTDTRATGKTQQYGVSVDIGAGPAVTGVWIDPSNQLNGNVVGRVRGWTPAAVTGAKGGNVALASLLSTLAGFGLITDSTT